MVNVFKKNLEELIGDKKVATWAAEKRLSVRPLQKYIKDGTPPSFENLVKIAIACNVRVGWLAAGEAPKERVSYDITDPATEFLEKLDAGAYRTKNEIIAAAKDTKAKLTLIKGKTDRSNIVGVESVFKRKTDHLNKEMRELFKRLLILNEHDHHDGYCRVCALVSERIEKLERNNLKKINLG